MEKNEVYQKRYNELKYTLEKFQDVKTKKDNVDKVVLKNTIELLVQAIDLAQIEIAEGVVTGDKAKNLLILLIEANNSLYKKDRYGIYCIYKQGFNISEPFYDVLKNNGLIKSHYVKSIPFEINPNNQNLNKILQPITSKDDLRPLMTGIHFKNDTAVSTDQYKMVHVKGKKIGDFQNGTYNTLEKLNKDYKNITPKGKLLMIEGIYPQYMRVLQSERENKVNVNISYLYSLIKNLIDNNLVNTTTTQFVIQVKNSENEKVNIGFGGENMNAVLNSLLLIGFKEMQMCYSQPSRAVLFTEVGLDWDSYSLDSTLSNKSWGLIMPLVFVNDLSEQPIIVIGSDGGMEIQFGNNVSKLTKAELFPKMSKIEPKKQVKKSDNYLQKKIESFELLLEVETDKNEIKFLKNKIEAFKLLNDL